MGLMDKAKQQATKLAEKSREAGEAARQKVGEVQDRRRADSLYRDLGELVYAERTGKAGATTRTGASGGGLGTRGAGQVATGGQTARTGGAPLLVPGLALVGAGGGLRRLVRRRPPR